MSLLFADLINFRKSMDAMQIPKVRSCHLKLECTLEALKNKHFTNVQVRLPTMKISFQKIESFLYATNYFNTQKDYLY